MKRLEFLRGIALATLAAQTAPVSALNPDEDNVGDPQESGLPPDSAYVQVKNGQLSLNGKRVRYWAAIGRVYIEAEVKPEDSPQTRAEKARLARKGTDILIQRYADLGINSVRLWNAHPASTDYTPGDGSPADSLDYFVHRMAEKGFKIWSAGLNLVGEAAPEDAGIVNDPATADAWKAAVAEFSGGRASIRNNMARIWDPRLEAIGLQRMKQVATHYNKYRKLRYCDDPTFIVWELSNEEWWMTRMLRGQWQQLPSYFRNQLIGRWNGWLKTKYGTTAALQSAWNGLLPGESLEQGTVLLAPTGERTAASAALNDGNPQAAAALQNLKQEYGRDDFAPSRGSDVLAFLLDLWMSHKDREAKVVKSWGKSCRLSPLVRDTGIGYEIFSQYLHQEADAVTHDAYTNGWGPTYREPDMTGVRNERERLYRKLDRERISANAGRWVNWLLKPPGLHQGVPWLEHNRVEGKPFLAYETQIQQPAKYRADYPLRVAALAAIQDWDFVCWHYFQPHGNPATEERPWDKRMDVTRVGGHPQGYHYTFDAVQNATMRAASAMFLNYQLKPAPRPTRFIYGRKSLLNPENMAYAGSYGLTGMDMIYTVYQYGVRIQIDPGRENDQVIGPVVKFADRHVHNPYTPTDQITFDWKKGYLLMDAPAAVAWTGLLANYGERVQFTHGKVTLKDVSFTNPEGIMDPVRPDEKYLAFALYSMDGQPLEKAKKLSLSLVSTSFNSGMTMSKDDGQPSDAPGNWPVLETRVAATVQSPLLRGMRFTLRDWHLEPLETGEIGADGVLRIPADKPIWVIELER